MWVWTVVVKKIITKTLLSVSKKIDAFICTIATFKNEKERKTLNSEVPLMIALHMIIFVTLVTLWFGSNTGQPAILSQLSYWRNKALPHF